MATPASLFRRLPGLDQRSRRIAVIASFFGYPVQIVGYSLIAAAGGVPGVAWGLTSIALFALTIVGTIAIYGYGQGRIDARKQLDERQRSMVDRAMILSYGVLTTVIVALGGLLAIYLSFVGPLEIEMSALTPWFIAIGLYVPFLPFAALAWIESDPPADDAA
jgi:hypothetical protein